MDDPFSPSSASDFSGRKDAETYKFHPYVDVEYLDRVQASYLRDDVVRAEAAASMDMLTASFKLLSTIVERRPEEEDCFLMDREMAEFTAGGGAEQSWPFLEGEVVSDRMVFLTRNRVRDRAGRAGVSRMCVESALNDFQENHRHIPSGSTLYFTLDKSEVTINQLMENSRYRDNDTVKWKEDLIFTSAKTGDTGTLYVEDAWTRVFGPFTGRAESKDGKDLGPVSYHLSFKPGCRPNGGHERRPKVSSPRVRILEGAGDAGIEFHVYEDTD